MTGMLGDVAQGTGGKQSACAKQVEAIDVVQEGDIAHHQCHAPGQAATYF